MDLQFASSCSPFSYLISEHARAVVAIQELQREVNSLLSFREYVLEALPQLQERGEPAPRPSRPTSAATGGKSLSEGGPSCTVVDSGFSTDKASTSMGKSSSSSSGEMMMSSGGGGGTRWENEAAAPPPGEPVVEGSVEDELWQLLDVIQKKGSKLRDDLKKAELSEREYVHVSDPPPGIHRPPQQQQPPRRDSLFVEGAGGPGGKGPPNWYPHSLPGTGPRLDFVAGLEAWGELERLRQDRHYLMGRLSRAETEAVSTHQRLMDLHGQLLSLAGEKRRLEDAFRKTGETGGGLSPGGHVRGGNRVTVSVKGSPSCEDPRRTSSVRIGDEQVQLPRVLKVPIKDKTKGGRGGPSQGGNSPSKTTTLLLPVKEDFQSSHGGAGGRVVIVKDDVQSSPQGGRLVIERERNGNRIDGGLSMPASLLKGTRIRVRPNKQRISAILKEKDFLSLQKQLLTTVMETEVMRRQMEIASEEWSTKVNEWENEKKLLTEAQNSLTKENETLKQQMTLKKEKRDVGTWAKPSMQSVGVGETDEEANSASHSVHEGPNVKYDVVVYEESSLNPSKMDYSHPESRKIESSPLRLVPPAPVPRKVAIEKPPRKTRPGCPSESSFSRESLGRVAKGSSSESSFSRESLGRVARGGLSESSSFGRDSLGRVAKVPLKSARSASASSSMTPNSSPAQSISKGASASRPGVTAPSNVSFGGRYVTRKDSFKVLQSTNNPHPRGLQSKDSIKVLQSTSNSPPSLTNGKSLLRGGGSSTPSPIKGSSATKASNKGPGPHKKLPKWCHPYQNGDIDQRRNSQDEDFDQRCNSHNGDIDQRRNSHNGDIEQSWLSSHRRNIHNGSIDQNWRSRLKPVIPPSSISPTSESLDYYDSISSLSPPIYLGANSPCDSLEESLPRTTGRRSVFLAPRVVKMKRCRERPTVLPAREENPLVLKGALDDVNLRVEQILNRIAARNSYN